MLQIALLIFISFEKEASGAPCQNWDGNTLDLNSDIYEVNYFSGFFV